MSQKKNKSGFAVMADVPGGDYLGQGNPCDCCLICERDSFDGIMAGDLLYIKREMPESGELAVVYGQEDAFRLCRFWQTLKGAVLYGDDGQTDLFEDGTENIPFFGRVTGFSRKLKREEAEQCPHTS